MPVPGGRSRDHAVAVSVPTTAVARALHVDRVIHKKVAYVILETVSAVKVAGRSQATPAIIDARAPCTMVVKIRLSRPNVIILRILLGLACVLVAWPYVTSFAAVGYGYAWWMVTPGPPRWDVSSPANATAVPKIIHQTWKEETVPEKWRAAQKSCRDLHPDYEYRLWTDSQALDFIEVREACG